MDITAADWIDELYIDGVLTKLQNPGLPNVLDHVNFADSTRVIAVSITNNGGSGGLVAAGIDFRSDDTWKVNTAQINHWEKVCCDDSAWSPATNYGSVVNNKTFKGITVPGMNPSANWISSNSVNFVGTTYFRKHLKK